MTVGGAARLSWERLSYTSFSHGEQSCHELEMDCESRWPDVLRVSPLT